MRSRPSEVRNIWGRARRYGGGLAAFVTLAIVAATCRDLTTAPEVGNVVIQYADTFTVTLPQSGVGKQITLKVGSELAPKFDVMIGLSKQPRARYFYSVGTGGKIEVRDNGNRIFIAQPGLDTVIATLVGATIGGKTNGAKLADTVLVSAKADSIYVEKRIVNFDALTAADTLDAAALDVSDVPIPGTAIQWTSLDPTVVAVNSPSPGVGVLTSVGNGTGATVRVVFADVDTVNIAVNVTQVLTKVAIRTPQGKGAQPNEFVTIGDTIGVRAIPEDRREQPMVGFNQPLTLAVSNPLVARVALVGSDSALLIAAGNSGESNTNRLFVSGLTTPVFSDTLDINVIQKATTISMTSPPFTIASVGGTKANIGAEARDARGNATPLTGISWTSDNIGVVVVIANATPTTVTATGVGTTKIRATRDGIPDSLTVTVTNDPARIELIPTSLSITSLQDTVQFSTIVARNANNDPLNISPTITSSDPAVVQVQPDGRKMVGKSISSTASVTVTAGSISTQVPVTVRDLPFTLDLANDTLRLTSIGQQDNTFSAVFTNRLGASLPRDAADWSSKDVSIARVSGNNDGTVTAVGPGITYVLAVNPGDPNRRDSIVVKVTDVTTSLSISPSPPPTLAAFGSTQSFTATATNALGNAPVGTLIRWSVISGTGFVSIDSVTGVATAVANGTATIQAIERSSGVTRTVPLTVAQSVSTTRSTIIPAATTITANGTSSTVVTVQLKDANDNNIAFGGSTVTLAASVGTLGAVTDAGNGRYTATLTSSTTSSTATVTGTANGSAISNNALVTFAAAAAAKYLVTSSSLTPTAGTSVTIRAQLADVNNNAVATAGNTVQFSSTNGGSFNPANGQASTDATGVAQITFTTSNAVASHTIKAETGGLTGTSAAINSVASGPTAYVVTPASTSPVAGSIVTITAQLRDGNGNPVALPDQAVAWTKSDPNGSFSSGGVPTTSTNTNASGVATIDLTTHTASATATTVRATTGGLTGLTSTITTVVGPASAAQTTAVVPGGTAGSPTTITIQARDAQGNPRTTPSGTVVVSVTGANTATPPVTEVNGTYTAIYTPTTVGADNVSITLGGTTIGGGPYSSNVTAGGVASFLVEGGSPIASQTAGTSFNIKITARDANGNTATSYTGIGNSVDISSTGTLNLGAGTTATFVSGVLASHTVRVVNTGSFTITATRTSGGTQFGTSNTFTVNPGAANAIAINGGDGQSATVGTAVATAPSVLITDASGNAVPGVAVTFAVTGGGGAITSPTGNVVTTNAAGVAALSSWTVGSAVGTNNNTLTATAGTLVGSPRTFTASGTVGSAQNIIANSSTTQSATVATTFNAAPALPSVVVRDANGNPVGGVSVTFKLTAAPGTGGVINGGTADVIVATNGSGVASLTTWTLGNVPGTNSVEASVAAFTLSGEPLAFSATATVGAVSAAQSSVVRTGGTDITANGVATSQITVTVRDAQSNVIPGQTVSLDDGAASSTITAPNGTTSNSAGQVVFTVTNTVAQTATYTATVGAVTITPTASVVFVPGPASATTSTVVRTGLSPITANGVASSTIRVTLLDAQSNPVSGRTVTLARSGSTSAITPASGTSNGSGQVDFTVTNTTSETVTYSATANDPGAITITQTAQVQFQAGTASNQIALT
ncbi:MAG: invasin domain 3-containing protein, partial [Gemmatimonadaceae bacterium]